MPATDDATWRDAFERVFLGATRLMRDLPPAIADGGATVMILAISAEEASPMPLRSGRAPPAPTPCCPTCSRPTG